MARPKITDVAGVGTAKATALAKNGIRTVAAMANAPIEKITFSCCGNGEFNDSLDKLKRDQIILCGIETHVCVYQTAFDLLRKNKQVAIATDAVSSRRPDARLLPAAPYSGTPFT